MNDLETELARLALRSAPPTWRVEILRAAQAVRPAEIVSGWRGWLRPQWLALAAAWLLIVVLHLAGPSAKATAAHADPARWRKLFEQRQIMFARLLRPTETQAPAPHGAAISSRRFFFV